MRDAYMGMILVWHQSKSLDDLEEALTNFATSWYGNVSDVMLSTGRSWNSFLDSLGTYGRRNGQYS